MDTLHHNVLLHIFAYLPIGTLKNIRCVSKGWLTILSTPRYVEGVFSSEQVESITRMEIKEFMWFVRNVGYFSTNIKKTIKAHVEKVLDNNDCMGTYPGREGDKGRTCRYLENYMDTPKNLCSIFQAMFSLFEEGTVTKIIGEEWRNITLWIKISAMFNENCYEYIPLDIFVDGDEITGYFDPGNHTTEELLLYLRTCAFTYKAEHMNDVTANLLTEVPPSTWITDEFISSVGEDMMADVVRRVNTSHALSAHENGWERYRINYKELGLEGDYPWLRDLFLENTEYD